MLLSRLQIKQAAVALNNIAALEANRVKDGKDGFSYGKPLEVCSAFIRARRKLTEIAEESEQAVQEAHRQHLSKQKASGDGNGELTGEHLAAYVAQANAYALERVEVDLKTVTLEEVGAGTCGVPESLLYGLYGSVITD